MATEKRLIDANALLEDARRCRPILDCLADIVDIQYLIDDQPTVDAVEVVHGRWEDMYDGKYANPRYRCSVCKEKAIYLFNRNSLGNWEEVQAKTNYCPHCGAKMDGDGND